MTLDYLGGIQFELTFTEENKLIFYFYQRTQSFVFSGERTDLNDVISVLFSFYISFFNKTASLLLINEPHPTDPCLDESEIYARYITPGQIQSKFLDCNSEGLEAVKNLLAAIYMWKIMFWKAVGCPCHECKEKLKPPFDYNIEINSGLKSRITKVLGVTEYHNQMTRFLPNWVYYKDFDKGVSVVYSPQLCSLMKHLYDIENQNFSYLKGETADLIFDINQKNTIDHNDKSLLSNLIDSLEQRSIETLCFVPLDNMLLCLGEDFLLFKESSSGYYDFKSEKEKVRQRYSDEARLLSPVTEFEWADKIDPDLFETMVKELLERESNVTRVRKVAPLNQGDNGRDLIMEIEEPSGVKGASGQSPYVVKNIIVQCKAYKKTVSKSNVTDIRDTIEHFDYDGYFLIVSSQIATSLTNHLDKMRNTGFWIDWWNREEIESRLSANKDILIKYESIVEGKK